MADDFKDPFDLIDDFLENELSESEARLMLSILKRNDHDFFVMLRANVKIDFLLREKAVVYGCSEPLPHSPFSCNRDQVGDLELFEKEYFKREGETNATSLTGLAELVAWERSAKPLCDSRIPRYTQKDQKEPVRPKSWWYWFLPCKKENLDKIEPTTKKHTSALVVIVLTVFFTLIGSAEIFRWRQSLPNRDVPFDTVGTIVETVDTRWEPTSETFKRGETIGANKFNLQSGMIKLMLTNGVELVFQGPGEFVVSNPMSTFCNSGRLSAKVPKSGIGFGVFTRFASVVDRGTEFYLEVDEENAFVETISGNVEVSLLKMPAISLPVGTGMKIGIAQNTESIATLSGRYIDSERFQKKLHEFVKQKEKELVTARQKELNSPDLLACFDFSDPLQSRIPNASVRGRSLVQEAVLRGGRSGETYRDAGKALVLDQTRDCVSFELPGSYRDMTIIAQVRIDQLMKTSNVILASALHHEQAGAILWQVLRDGRMQLQITPPRKKIQESCFHSSSFFHRHYYGTWCTLAVVVEGTGKRISFYHDGKLSAAVPWENPIPLVFGQTGIGNITEVTGNAENRSLSGAVSEMLIFDRALSGEEIETFSNARNY